MVKSHNQTKHPDKEMNQEIAAEITDTVEELTNEVNQELAEESAEKAKPKTKAKAGKRSSKAEKEAAAEEAKAVRKEAKQAAEEQPRPKQKPRIKKYSKNQTAMRAAIDFDKSYALDEAISLLQKVSKAKFDPTLEFHIRLDIDPRQADQTIRTSTVLPAGSGKAVRVAVLTGDDKKAAAAKKAGAELTNSEDIIASIEKGSLEFDVLVASPDMMVQLGRHAKTLGPKGLMPSPKSGTVAADPAAAVEEIKKGRLEIKNDANGIVHLALGKLSFKNEDLIANARAILATIQSNRPSGVKGVFVKSITLAATMTPGIKIDSAELITR